MMTAMKALDKQETELETIRNKNKQAAAPDFSKQLQEETRQLCRVAQTHQALRATFKESRTNDSCTRADFWDLMVGGGIQHQREVRLAWIASEKGE